MDLAAIQKNLKLLLLSGFSLGFNWVFLFAGYRHGIAISSLCNYMAPIIVVIITALIYKEKYCVIYGLLAALGFVILVLCNRRLEGIEPLEKTLVQLLASAAIVFPYVAINRGFPTSFDLTSSIIVLILGFLHTGVAYICYFSSINVLSPQSIAILGYLEPVLNFVIGVLVFREPLGFTSILGASFILIASLGNELSHQE